ARRSRRADHRFWTMWVRRAEAGGFSSAIGCMGERGSLFRGAGRLFAGGWFRNARRTFVRVASAGQGACGTLEPRDFGEVEVADSHGRDDHVEGLLSGGALDGGKLLHVAEHFDQVFVEAEITQTGSDGAIFDEECTVAGHAGEDLGVGIDLADIPEAGDEDTARRGSDHFL